MTDSGVVGLPANSYDLVFSAFTFDNIPTMEKKVVLFQSLKALLKESGRIVNLVSDPAFMSTNGHRSRRKIFQRTEMLGAGIRFTLLCSM